MTDTSVETTRLDTLIDTLETTSSTYLDIAESLDALELDVGSARTLHEIMQRAYDDNQQALMHLRVLNSSVDESTGRHPSALRVVR